MSTHRSRRDRNKPLHLVNDRIRISPVMLVTEDGENRVMELPEALELAKSQELDLVMINEKASPPVVKVLDYGKFLYEIKKKKKNVNRVQSKVKSITVKPQISDHDMGWKADKAVEWLKLGDKVQFIVKAPGRMHERIDLINEVYRNFVQLVENYGRPKDELKKISKIQYATYFFPVGKG